MKTINRSMYIVIALGMLLCGCSAEQSKRDTADYVFNSNSAFCSFEKAFSVVKEVAGVIEVCADITYYSFEEEAWVFILDAQTDEGMTHIECGVSLDGSLYDLMQEPIADAFLPQFSYTTSSLYEKASKYVLDNYPEIVDDVDFVYVSRYGFFDTLVRFYYDCFTPDHYSNNDYEYGRSDSSLFLYEYGIYVECDYSTGEVIACDPYGIEQKQETILSDLNENILTYCSFSKELLTLYDSTVQLSYADVLELITSLNLNDVDPLAFGGLSIASRSFPECIKVNPINETVEIVYAGYSDNLLRSAFSIIWSSSENIELGIELNNTDGYWYLRV